jgi:DNA-binding MarR family transcriptional regulator
VPEPSPDPDRVAAIRALVRLARLLERACPELSLAHYRVLAAVAAGDRQASRVAVRLALAKPTISASVDALCRRGLLTREDVAGDQRATALRLTPSGRAVLREAEAAMSARLEQVLSRTEDADAAVPALARLGAGLDVLADERLRARLAERAGAPDASKGRCR